MVEIMSPNKEAERNIVREILLPNNPIQQHCQMLRVAEILDPLSLLLDSNPIAPMSQELNRLNMPCQSSRTGIEEYESMQK
jgi:hypothetical protein